MTNKQANSTASPKKDVIYIDVDDDITAIIGKVKESKGTIVALVPPKRIGVLQSAVNLRLLERAASAGKKRLVLITTNQALIGLAATAKLPIAKSLQSKPEMAEIPALLVDDGDDVIDGSELSIGEHAGIAKDPLDQIDEESAPLETAPKKSAKSLTKSPKVPDFSAFRKRLVLGALLLVGFIGFGIWAIWFAPRATVIVDAKTSAVNISTAVSLTDSAETSADKAVIRAIEQTTTREESVSFQPTGEKNMGDKASGTVEFSTTSLSGFGTIPAGTNLTSSSGKVYVTNQAVTLDGDDINGFVAKDTVGITAAESGASYNGATGTMSGAPSNVSAKLTDATTGGTDKVVKVVTQADVDKAREELDKKVAALDESKVEAEMNFADDVVVIKDSLRSDDAKPTVSPAVNEEASGSGTVTLSLKYHMYGVAKSELEKFLDAAVEERIANDSTQRVFKNGIDTVVLDDFAPSDKLPTVTITAKGQTGPSITEKEIKARVQGKRFGEIQSELEKITGIEQADTKFWPFWVSVVPNDTDRIKVEFRLNDA